MAEDFYDPLAHLVGYYQAQRDQKRQAEDAELDRRITLLHDMISGPGANPARTAEGIKGILELESAKGGRAPTKRGTSGFMGEHELPMPEILAGLIHGTIPFQGPTQQAVPPPKSAAEQGLLPQAGMTSPGLKGFDGKSVLNAPVYVPPEPIQMPPSADKLVSAGRQMQAYNEGPKVVPVKNQPIRMSPEEQAQQAGSAAGILKGAQADAEWQAEERMWKSLGASPEEIKRAKLAKLTGTQTPYRFDTTPQLYRLPDGTTVEGYQVGDQATGSFTVRDRYGLPIPKEAQPIGSTSGQTTTSTDKNGNVWLIDKVGGTATMVRTATGQPPGKPVQGHFTAGYAQGGKSAFVIQDPFNGSILAEGVYEDMPVIAPQPGSQQPPSGLPVASPTQPATPGMSEPQPTQPKVVTPSGTVKMKGPDGSIADVPVDEVEHFKQTVGATVVGEEANIPSPPAKMSFTAGKPPQPTQQDKQTASDIAKARPLIDRLEKELQKTVNPQTGKMPNDWRTQIHEMGQAGKYSILHQSPTDPIYREAIPLAAFLKVFLTQPYLRGMRNFKYVEQIQQHVPSMDLPFPDTPENMYNKLQIIKQNFDDMEKEMKQGTLFTPQPQGATE